ncbi:MAG: N4-gp56 family major capsid protein [Patescibacteria group bacterium]
MANTTLTQVAQGVNNFYDRNMLERALPLLIHTKFGQVRDIPKNESDVIKFRRYGNLTAATTALSEGITPAGSQLSVTDVTATVLQYGDYVTLTDKLQMTTLDPVLMETSDLLGDQSGDTIDQLCRDVIVAGTTVQYASTAVSRVTVSAAMKMSLDETKEAVRTLKNAKAKKVTNMVMPQVNIATQPIQASYIGICHPNTTYDLKVATGWKSVETYANKADVMPGEVGSLDEVRFLETTNAKVFTGAGASGVDVYATLIIAANAYGVTRVSGEALKNIVKPLGSAGSADPLDQRSTSGWKATFVAKILNETWIVRIEHGVTA